MSSLPKLRPATATELAGRRILRFTFGALDFLWLQGRSTTAAELHRSRILCPTLWTFHFGYWKKACSTVAAKLGSNRVLGSTAWTQYDLLRTCRCLGLLHRFCQSCSQGDSNSCSDSSGSGSVSGWKLRSCFFHVLQSHGLSTHS